MKFTTFLGLHRHLLWPTSSAPNPVRLASGEPHDTPYYGFNVVASSSGHPANDKKKPGPGGVETYWGVTSIAEAWPRLLAAGATAIDEPNDVGEGIQVAAVADPFGNILGLIENPSFPNKA
jgi:predicted enzyme related to lactoylglutathione lyase